MKPAEQFYKKLLAYDDDINLMESSPYTHRGVIHFANEYANQYKELLSKYIQHVEECEGTNFINSTFSDVNFTDNELKLLKELADKPLPEKP